MVAEVFERDESVGWPCGVPAARAMIRGSDYASLVQPLREHVENIPAFRKPYERLDNAGLDRLVPIVDRPGIKHAVHNTGIDFADLVGRLLQKFQQ